MSDGITEARRGSYFSDKNKNVSTTGKAKHNKYYYDVNRNKPYKDYTSTGTEFKSIWVGNKEEDLDHMPNQKWHRYVSFAKSTVRIAGYILIPFNLESAAIVLILSEVIGIVEELV